MQKDDKNTKGIKQPKEDAATTVEDKNKKGKQETDDINELAEKAFSEI